MTTYNVHIHREMRLVFGGIEAASHEEAAAIAREKPTEYADEFDDCPGETFYALVDVHGDKQHEQSRFIDFEPERLRLAARKLLRACRMVVDRWEQGDLEETQDYLEEAAWACATAVAEAQSTSARHRSRSPRALSAASPIRRSCRNPTSETKNGGTAMTTYYVKQTQGDWQPIEAESVEAAAERYLAEYTDPAEDSTSWNDLAVRGPEGEFFFPRNGGGFPVPGRKREAGQGECDP